MKKYLLDSALLANLISAGGNMPSATWAFEVYQLSNRGIWGLTQAQRKRVEKLADKAIHAIAKAYSLAETAPSPDDIIQFLYPAEEDGEIEVQYFPRHDFARRTTVDGRAQHAVRVSTLKAVQILNIDQALNTVSGILKPMIGTAPLAVEARPRKDGTLVFSLVPKPEPGQPKYYESARWPIWVEQPSPLDTANILMVGSSKAKVVDASTLEGIEKHHYFVKTNNITQADWVKRDVEAVAATLPDRLVAAREVYYREVRARMRSNMTAAPKTPKERTAAEKAQAVADFDKHRLARKKKLEESLKGKQAISLLPMTNHGFASSRRWGIEIESGGARGIDSPAGWKRKGDGSLRSAWDGHIDAEGTQHYSQHDDCAEFVSPILGSMHSKGLETLLAQIILQPQNDTAGVHVHVEANDLSPRQLGSLVYGYDMVEGLIESSYRRTRRNYAKYRDTKQTMDILQSAKKTDKLSSVQRGERYVTLNLQALDQHGTVEFRAMGNVYEYDHLIRWALFCREMVNLAKAGVSVKEWNSVNSWADLTSLFAKYGKEYIRAVMDTLGESVPSAPRLDTHDGTVSMPTGSEKKTEKIVTKVSTLSELAATMDPVAVNSRWESTVESSLAAIGEGSQRVLVGALASGATEV